MSSLERCRRAAEASDGSAVLVVLMGMLLLSAVGLGTVLVATADTLASANQRDAVSALYAAEAGVELAAAELAAASDWDAVLAGAAVSAFSDGQPSGQRTLPHGGTIRLDDIACLATCGAAGGCSAAARQTVTDDRPWGANNPNWRPYRYGRVVAGGSSPDIYLVVLVGDDPAENDADPERDGLPPANPGAGVLMLRAEAFGPGMSRRSVEATMVRVSVPGGAAVPRFLSWKEVR